MKELKELKFEDLSVEQKLGLVLTVNPCGYFDLEEFDGENEFIFDLIKNHALGAVWITPTMKNADVLMKKIKEIADYPILIITDAESGLGDYKIGKHNALGRADSEDLAYTFGKITAITARKMGYNVVCNPLLDMANNGSERYFGYDKYKVTALAKAEAQGLHDGGVLTVGKHYPSGNNVYDVDSHMAEALSDNTKEELLEYSLYPYMELDKAGLLDGVMTSHKRFINIDDTRPASLSKPVLNIFREQGFNGFMITDALCMMGIQAKYSEQGPNGLCIEAGNDLALPFTYHTKDHYNQMVECYKKGMIPDERLDEAVKRVLEAQHKTMIAPKFTEYEDEDIETFNTINQKSIIVVKDEDIPTSISRDGKHYFAVMVDNNVKLSSDGSVDVDTFTENWKDPATIMGKIKELFPNSQTKAIYQFPSQDQLSKVLSESLGFENVIFITFAEALAYTGSAHLTRRIETIINAMQITNRISTLIHFGVPTVLENLAHIPRIIFGGTSPDGVKYSLEALAGKFEPTGKLTYDVKLK